MTRALVLWSDPTSTNLGVQVLAHGAAALVRRVDPDADVEFQNYGHGPAPINIGVPRTLLREAVQDARGTKGWLRGYDVVLDTRAGDSFADIYGLRRHLTMTAMAQLVTRCGVPLVLPPQTIGPFGTRRGALLARRTLRTADVVMARDARSAQESAALGRPVDLLTTDVVFALPVPTAHVAHDVVLNVSGLLWQPNSHVDHLAYRRTVAGVVAGLRERGREVTLLAHVLDSPDPDNDVPAVRAAGEEHGCETLIPTSLDEVRTALAGAELVLGSRMHACLNALSVGTPAIPLAYSRKFAPLLGDIGWTHVVDLRADEATVVPAVLAEVDRGVELRESAAAVTATAQEHLTATDRLIGDVIGARVGTS